MKRGFGKPKLLFGAMAEGRAKSTRRSIGTLQSSEPTSR
jgi:hypothetical protein